jgi:3-phenylpropionate/trans-cinnamate dioxygenase ferredoxin subunit
MRAARVAGGEVLICHTPAGLYALDATCSHACARMDEGRLRGTRLTCALHGAAFDAASGAVLKGPALVPLRTHAVRVVAGCVEVGLGP